MPYTSPTGRRPFSSVNLDLTMSTFTSGLHATPPPSSNKENEPSPSFNMRWHRPADSGFAPIEPFVPMVSPWRNGVQDSPTKTTFKVQTGLPAALTKRPPLGLFDQSSQDYCSPPRPAPFSISPAKAQPYAASKLSRVPSLIPGSPIRNPSANASAGVSSDQRRGLISSEEGADGASLEEYPQLRESFNRMTFGAGMRAGGSWYEESFNAGAISDQSTASGTSSSEVAGTLPDPTSIFHEEIATYSPQIDDHLCQEPSYSEIMPYLTPLPDDSTMSSFDAPSGQSDEIEELQESTELLFSVSPEQLSDSSDLASAPTVSGESDSTTSHSKIQAGGVSKGLVTESILSFDAFLERECASMDEGGITQGSVIASSFDGHGSYITQEVSQVVAQEYFDVSVGFSEDAVGESVDISKSDWTASVAESMPLPSPKAMIPTERDASLSAYTANVDLIQDMPPTRSVATPAPVPSTPTRVHRGSRTTADGNLSELISKETVLYATPAYQYEPFEFGASVSEADKTVDTTQLDTCTQGLVAVEKDEAESTESTESTESSDFTDVVLAREKVDVSQAPVNAAESQEKRQPVTITIRMPRGEDYVNPHKASLQSSTPQPRATLPTQPASSRSHKTLLSVSGIKVSPPSDKEGIRPPKAFISPSSSYYADQLESSSGQVVQPTVAQVFAIESGREARGGRSHAQHMVYTFHQQRKRSPSSPYSGHVIQLPDPVRPARCKEYVQEQKSTTRWLWFCFIAGFFCFPFWMVGGWYVGSTQLKEWYKADGHDLADRQAIKAEAERRDEANKAPVVIAQPLNSQAITQVGASHGRPSRLYECRRMPSVAHTCVPCYQPLSKAVPPVTASTAGTHIDVDVSTSVTQERLEKETATSCASSTVGALSNFSEPESEPEHYHSVLARSAEHQSNNLEVPTHRAIRHNESHPTLASTASTIMTAPSARSGASFCPRGLSPKPPSAVLLTESSSQGSVGSSEVRDGAGNQQEGVEEASVTEGSTNSGSRVDSPGCGTPLTAITPSAYNPRLSHHALAKANANTSAKPTATSAYDGFDEEVGEGPGWTRETGIMRVKKLRRMNQVAALVGVSLEVGIATGFAVGFIYGP
ncbi:hypothetical protein IAR50_003650 [Cryptococcus sp. DSM 104548]